MKGQEKCTILYKANENRPDVLYVSNSSIYCRTSAELTLSPKRGWSRYDVLIKLNCVTRPEAPMDLKRGVQLARPRQSAAPHQAGQADSTEIAPPSGTSRKKLQVAQTHSL